MVFVFPLCSPSSSIQWISKTSLLLSVEGQNVPLPFAGFLSPPHFLWSPPEVRENVIGLNPNNTAHYPAAFDIQPVSSPGKVNLKAKIGCGGEPIFSSSPEKNRHFSQKMAWGGSSYTWALENMLSQGRVPIGPQLYGRCISEKCMRAGNVRYKHIQELRRETPLLRWHYPGTRLSKGWRRNRNEREKKVLKRLLLTQPSSTSLLHNVTW